MSYEQVASNVTGIARETAKILEETRQEINQTIIQNDIFDFSKYIKQQSYKDVYSPSTSGISILYLYGDETLVSKENTVSFTFKFGSKIDGYKEGNCTLKWQGNSSLNFRKKNYTINKITPKLNVGWGEQKKYVLKANASDPSMARNVVTAKLWGDVVQSRTTGGEITEKLKTLPNGGAIDGFPIMLVVNDEYKGVYTFNIPKDDYLFGMGDSDTEGFLCNESGTAATLFKGPLDEEGLRSERSGQSIGYVPDEDNIQWIVDSFNNMVNVVKDLDSPSYKGVIADYIEVQSFIDCMLFSYMTGNEDVTNKNSLNGTFNGVKWFRSMYDLDQSFGGHFQGKYIKPVNWYALSLFTGNKVWWLIYKYDKAILKSRYQELRNGPMSEINVYDKFTNFVAQIPRVLVQEENKIWYDLPLTGVDPVSSIVDWYRLRCQYMDAEIAAL